MNRASGAVLVSLLALAGCKPAAVRDAEAAERRYAMVKANGTLAEACAQANEVRDSWLKALDQQKYQTAQMQASLDCSEVGLYGGGMPASAVASGTVPSPEDALGGANDALRNAKGSIEDAKRSIHGDSPAQNSATESADEIGRDNFSGE